MELGGGLIALFRPRIHHRTVPMWCWSIDRAVVLVPVVNVEQIGLLMKMTGSLISLGLLMKKTMMNDQVNKCSYHMYPNLINLGKVYIFLIDI